MDDTPLQQGVRALGLLEEGFEDSPAELVD
jgi:hypothetical protein